MTQDFLGEKLISKQAISRHFALKIQTQRAVSGFALNRAIQLFITFSYQSHFKCLCLFERPWNVELLYTNHHCCQSVTSVSKGRHQDWHQIPIKANNISQIVKAAALAVAGFPHVSNMAAFRFSIAFFEHHHTYIGRICLPAHHNELATVARS